MYVVCIATAAASAVVMLCHDGVLLWCGAVWCGSCQIDDLLIDLCIDVCIDVWMFYMLRSPSTAMDVRLI